MGKLYQHVKFDVMKEDWERADVEDIDMQTQTIYEELSWNMPMCIEAWVATSDIPKLEKVLAADEGSENNAPSPT